MKTKHIKIPIYYGSLTVNICNDDSEMAEFGRRNKLYSTEGFEAFFYTTRRKSGGNNYIIVFKEGVSPDVIAHECLHFVNKRLTDSYVKLDPENDEPQAYMLSWAVRQCHSAIDALNKKLR